MALDEHRCPTRYVERDDARSELIWSCTLRFWCAMTCRQLMIVQENKSVKVWEIERKKEKEGSSRKRRMNGNSIARHKPMCVCVCVII